MMCNIVSDNTKILHNSRVVSSIKVLSIRFYYIYYFNCWIFYNSEYHKSSTTRHLFLPIKSQK